VESFLLKEIGQRVWLFSVTRAWILYNFLSLKRAVILSNPCKSYGSCIMRPTMLFKQWLFLESYSSTRLPSLTLNYQSIFRGSNHAREVTGLDVIDSNPSTTDGGFIKINMNLEACYRANYNHQDKTEN
jgi:hypothetical protein